VLNTINQPTIKFKNSRTLIGFSKNNNKGLDCVQHYTTSASREGFIPAPVFFFLFLKMITIQQKSSLL